ncbi:phospholipase [Thioalkalivibrio denitrificans]|uniref:TVP38/TMEM64 family membrane protein n=1 Tax=Thioalkalivibrio denitrificans TaxID=108003 RepID=A0A1V3NR18_9GAMM|nr:VTT domain-containing protein [Thioalkalivibrio denitrificans]OOG27559.1 phospholipase [Thioalkalivibrio denitrificans]
MTPRLRLILFLSVIAALLVLAAFWAIVMHEGDWQPAHIQARAGQLAEGPWLHWLVFAGVVLGQQVAIPQILLVPVAVILLGPWWGLAVGYFGTLAGAVIGYLIGRYVGRRPVRRLSGPRMRRLSRAIARRGVVSMIVVNMLPIVSQALINLAAGTTHIRFRDFLLGTAVGIVPPTVIVVAATQLVLQVERMPETGEVFVIMLVVFAALVLLWWATRRAWAWLGDW